MRRVGALAFLAGALLILVSAPAGAHALVRNSDPASGSVLNHAPSKVVITFTERPDPKLTSVQVLDSAGTDHAQGDPQPVPGQPLDIEVAVDRLSDGVYTVAWRTISEADGHTT